MPNGQLQRVRFDRRLSPDQVAALNARLGRLPDIIAQRERARLTEAQIAGMQEERNIARKRLRQQERESRAALGLEAAKTGAGILIGGKSGIGGTLLSDVGRGVKSLFTTGTPTSAVADVPRFGGFQTAGAVTPPGGTAPPSGILGKIGGGLTLGSTLGAGALGFGAANLLGGGKKGSLLKKFGIGAGAGILSGLFGTGGFGAGTLTSGLFGGLGGLAGGIF